MTRKRAASSKRPSRPAVILAFGEDLHDSDSIRHLVKYFRSDLPRVVSRPKPVSLSGSPGTEAVAKWMKDLTNAVDATEAGGQPVHAVLLHVDSDGADPTGSRAKELALALKDVPKAHPVVPVQCTEAWWFLFPNQVESVRPIAWKDRLPRGARDVEMISNPKAELRRLTRKSGSEYAESDSPRIAEKIADAKASMTGSSKSFNRFGEVVRAL